MADIYTVKAIHSLHFGREWARRIAALVLLTFFCFQVFQWQSFALRVTHLEVLSLTRGLSLKEDLEWGGICNAIGDYRCAKRIFRRILNRYFSQPQALANFAIAQARLGECRQALESFRDHRRLMGEGPDVAHWRGKCHQQLGQVDEALDAHYAAVSLASERFDFASELVDFLLEQARVEEALSVIASLTQGQPERHPLWRKKLAEIDLSRPELTLQQGLLGQKRALRLPSLDGRHFWIPVRSSSQSAPSFWVVDPKQTGLHLPEADELRLAHLARNADRRLASEGEGSIPRLQVGPWFFEDFKFQSCTDCKPRVGQSLLTHFEVYEEMISGVRFLILYPL